MKIWQKFTLAVAATAALFVGGAVAGQQQTSAAADYSEYTQKGLKNVTHKTRYVGYVSVNAKTPIQPATGVALIPPMAPKKMDLAVDMLLTTKSGQFFQLANGAGYIKAQQARPVNLGILHVNYNKHYGIQIWNQYGQPVRYNKAEAKKMHHKVNDAKKLPGQTNWKIFGLNELFDNNGKSLGMYVNLGGDQYIDFNYIKFQLKPQYDKEFFG